MSSLAAPGSSLSPGSSEHGCSHGPAGRERRRAVRYEPAPGGVLRCLLIADEDGAERDADLRDVSTGGVGLLAGQAVEAGASAFLKVYRSPAPCPRLLLVHVRHSRPLADGRFLIGCEFAKPLSHHGMRELFLRA